jgi:hypothetical protein
VHNVYSMKILYSVAVGVGAFFALNCGSGDEIYPSTAGMHTAAAIAAR